MPTKMEDPKRPASRVRASSKTPASGVEAILRKEAHRNGNGNGNGHGSGHRASPSERPSQGAAAGPPSQRGTPRTDVAAEGPTSKRLTAATAAATRILSARHDGSPEAVLESVVDVLRQVRAGDFSVRLPKRGTLHQRDAAEAVNELVDIIESMSRELVRISNVVGREGKMTERASLPLARGGWAVEVDALNSLIGDLVRPSTEVARVITAVAQGDLSQKMALEIDGKPVRGEFLRIGTTVNTMVDQLSSFSAEVTRVAKEVGTEGKLGGQADVKGVSGTWKDLTDNVNLLASNLTVQLRDVSKVSTAIANGDLTQKITVDVKGEILQIKDVINQMVDRLSTFAGEVTRVAREVGSEGKLGVQAEVQGVSGTWKGLTDSVNGLAASLTVQLRDVSHVATAIANGDLTQKITVDVKGEILQIKNSMNQMVDSLRTFAGEVTRVAREVGTDGKLGGQAYVPGVAGTWKDLTDSVNYMARNLTDQVRNVALVTTAVAKGDLSQKITVDVKGEMLELKNTMNVMVDQLRSFSAEVTRVAREVGTDGKLGGQANVPGVAGTWKDLTDNVNYMASNLTNQVRNIAEVVTGVARGDLTKKLQLEARGEFAELADTINGLTDTLRIFAEQVTTVAREAGTDGKLGGQARVPGVAGTWKDLTDNVNSMVANLTDQVRNVAFVATAVANGDLSQKITVDVKGEVLELKNTMNVMVDQLRSFAAEVTRVAKEVGTEGKLGGQANVPGVGGTWKDLTDNVNYMARNLTDQVRSIALVTTAVANGDLSQKITVDARGETLELKNTINTMVDQLRSFSAEVTRVAREVGTDGKLGGQANVPGVGGTWKDLTDSVNYMASNLTNQVRNIALVSTAVANGDLSQKITVDVKGEMLELKNTINTMVDQLRSFSAEVTRVAREVGTEGKLGGQANVPGVGGTWKDLTDSVNYMASNLTDQVRNIALVTTAIATGDLSQKITVDVKGEMLELKNTINTMVDQLRSFSAEVTRVAREVGTQGKLGGQAYVPGVAGTWKDLTDNVNSMASNLTTQVRGIIKVVTAVANGDLSRKLILDAKGEIADLVDTINDMTETLGIFAEQVTTVAREVGTEGKLGGQARVPGVAGTWKDLTDSVNSMASNLTTQVRGIVKVVTAIANGDLSQKFLIEAKGEMAALADTINSMTDTLRVFADQVTTVAREVGTEGKLGGQAKVPGASGTWRDLTDNVNQLAGNLTAQVRAIADVATAVTKGDLTRIINVEAQGELLALKDNVNQMIANLRDTTERNREQDWLKTNLAKFSSMMQGQKNLEAVSRLIMSELTPLVSAHHGAFYIADTESSGGTILKLIASYAYKERKLVGNKFALGEGLVGQCAIEKKSILLVSVPNDYIQINSGLGEAPPLNIVVLPVLFEGQVRAVIELASFQPFSQIHQLFLDQLTESVGVVLNMIVANMRTEELLLQSQSLTQELQSQSKELQIQQEELKKSNGELEAQAKSLKASEELLKEQQEELQQINEELEEKAALLAEQNTKVEQKNHEVELAKKALEEKAEQVALSSKYKSEFLANMSHELRTPLNSLLILAKLLGENKEANMNGKQVEYAQTIHSAGTDLLNLINEVLDLSKVEAGKMEIYPAEVPIGEIQGFVERSFRPVAQQKGLDFVVTVDSDLPHRVHTDGQRLQQVLRNLLSNAFKFTERGQVSVHVGVAPSNLPFGRDSLLGAHRVISFAVRDTGIGIPQEKQKLIFEAFQQADGTTSRKYGGTGLGLSISRELTRLLGGEIHVDSAPGAGSVFTLYLPDEFRGPAAQDEELPIIPSSAPSQGHVPALTDMDLEMRGVDGITLDVDITDNVLSDDRDNILTQDKVILIVEDDIDFAKVLLDIARERGFRGIVAVRGDTGLALAHRFKPDAILLDVMLPVVDGLVVLDRLKRHPETRHIPVHILSATDHGHRSLGLGALSFLEKPVSKEALDQAFTSIRSFLDAGVRNLLIVEDDDLQRKSLMELVGEDDLSITAVGTAEGALEELSKKHFDCMVVDLGLPDMTGFNLLERVKNSPELKQIPIVIYTGKELSKKEETRLKKYAEAIIIKNTKSLERLLDETALFLHRVEANLPEPKRRVLQQLHEKDVVFAGKRVLVVDDDVRNIFAITSVLENNGMQVIYAENGKDGIELLEKTPDVSLVLMDVMMPEMDGYETMRAIRKLGQHKSLPIIALTAKAMKGDREKCIAAGASDYITKPVDPDQLLSLMRVWMYR